MLNNKKALALAGAGLAIFAAYKYSKMSKIQKDELHSSLKEKGRSLAKKFSPEELKAKFNKADAEGNFKAGF